MGYRIVLLQNGEYKKTMHKCQTLSTSMTNFNRFIEEGAKVKFPRKFVNSNKIVPVDHKLYLVKDIEKDDKNRLVRDMYGRLYEEKPLFGKWTVIDDHEYFFEESFYVYGFDPVHNRKDVDFVMGLMMKNIEIQTMSKSIVVINNKLLIYNENQFDMVLCKCYEDSRRLYNVLLEYALSKNYKRLIFLGEANEHLTNRLYKMIMEETGWDYRKVTRSTTGPTNYK